MKVEDLSMLIEAALRHRRLRTVRSDFVSHLGDEPVHSPHDEGNGVPPHASRERHRTIDRAPKPEIATVAFLDVSDNRRAGGCATRCQLISVETSYRAVAAR